MKRVILVITLIILTACQDSNVYLLNKNNIYGEMYLHSDAGVATTISDTTTYFNVTGFQAGALNGFTYTNDILTAQQAGLYKVDWHLGFSNGANDLFEITVNLNGVEQEECETHRKLGASGDEGSTAGTCFLRLAVNDDISLGAQDATATSTLTAFGANVNLLRVAS